jgi:hypothetical protein
MANVLNGQLSLFGGLCPACGVTPAYVQYRRRVIRLLRCVTCHAPVEDLSCGCGDVKGEGPGGHRGQG